MNTHLLFVIICITKGLVGVFSCDPEIIKKIKTNVKLEEFNDFIPYVSNKMFLSVWMARKHTCRECYTGAVRCHWAKYLRNRDKDDQISSYNFFRTRKLTARAVIYSELGRVLTKYKANVLVEINDKTEVQEYFVFPLYINKEEGVIAYHRCKVDKKHPWYTVVAVDNDKFSKYPGQPDWLAVNEAKLKIQDLSLKHHLYNGKPLPDPYGCKNHLYHLGL